MWPDQVSNPGHLTYESRALDIVCGKEDAGWGGGGEAMRTKAFIIRIL